MQLKMHQTQTKIKSKSPACLIFLEIGGSTLFTNTKEKREGGKKEGVQLDHNFNVPPIVFSLLHLMRFLSNRKKRKVRGVGSLKNPT